MSVIKAVQAILAADPALAALVGGRIGPWENAGVTAAHVTHTLVSRVPDMHLAGRSGITRAGVQLDAWSPDTSEAQAVAGEVDRVMDAANGATAAGVRIDHARLEGEQDLSEPPPDAGGAGYGRISQTWELWFSPE